MAANWRTCSELGGQMGCCCVNPVIHGLVNKITIYRGHIDFFLRYECLRFFFY